MEIKPAVGQEVFLRQLVARTAGPDLPIFGALSSFPDVIYQGDSK
jgi:hypothetical protein